MVINIKINAYLIVGENMEEIIKQDTTIFLKNRKRMELKGVKKLDSFDKKEFLLDTNLGFLHVKGKDLSLGAMDMEKGELIIEGIINSLNYIDEAKEKKEGFLKKLFK